MCEGEEGVEGEVRRREVSFKGGISGVVEHRVEEGDIIGRKEYPPVEHRKSSV